MYEGVPQVDPPASAAAATAAAAQWERYLVDGITGGARMVAMAEALVITQVVALAQVRRAEAAHDAQADRLAGRMTPVDAVETERLIADEVAVALHWSPRVALGRIIAMENLVNRAPLAFVALEKGRIDAGRAYLIAEGMAVLAPETAAGIEAGVVEAAERSTRAQVAATVRRAVIAADPDAADRAYQAAKAARRARVQAEDDGMASIWITGPADQVSAAWQTMTAVAADRVRHRTEERRTARAHGADPADLPEALTLDQARADAALDMLRDLDELPDPGDGAGPVTVRVGVVIPATDLSQPGSPPAEMTGHGPIPAAMLSDLLTAGRDRGCSDAEMVHLTRWVTDSRGVVVHAGAGYRPSPSVDALVRARDATCRFPGCRTPAHQCDLDHTVPHPVGATEPANLAALCRRHHRLKTHTRWQLRQQPGGILEWTSPSGHVHVTHPPTWAVPPPRRAGRTGVDDPAPF